MNEHYNVHIKKISKFKNFHDTCSIITIELTVDLTAGVLCNCNDLVLIVIPTDFCGTPNVTVNPNETQSIQTLPTFPNFYPPNMKCYWYITASEGNIITIMFKYFDVTTARDYLYIGYGHIISSNTTVIRVTGSSKPNSVIIDSATAWLYFSGPSGFWWGFVLSLTADYQSG